MTTPKNTLLLSIIAVITIHGSLLVAHAQDSVRPSLTGATAAEARRPSDGPGNYNMKLGPVYFDLTGELETSFNDNVYLSDEQRESDFILRPNLSLHTFWQATRMNVLSIDIGIGYSKYLDHSDLDTSGLMIAPNSAVSFDIYVGNVLINLHDRFSITQNPVDEALLSGVGKFDRFQNAAGISFLCDLNDLVLFFGYDHYNFWSLSDEFETLDRSEEQFAFSASAKVNEATVTGLDVSASIIDYDQDFQNDGWSGSVGPFIELQVTRHLKFRASAGYQMMSFDAGGGNGDASDLNGWFAYMNLSHQMNSRVTEALAIGHESRLGLVTNYAEVDYARYLINWQMSSALSSSLDLLYENARESSGGTFESEDSQRFSAGASLEYAVSRKLSVGLRYRYSLKDSNLLLRDYYQNLVSAVVRYDF
jgi:hypothetical protein